MNWVNLVIAIVMALFSGMCLAPFIRTDTWKVFVRFWIGLMLLAGATLLIGVSL